MRSDDLTPEQTEAMAQTLARYARYLSGVIERMHKLHWPKDDPLYARALTARDAMMTLVATVQDVKKNNAQPRWIRANASYQPSSTVGNDPL